jgi:hypothetical protein
LDLKNKNITKGVALAGAGFLYFGIKSRRKFNELAQRLNYTEGLLEDLEEKSWSLNRSIKEMAKAHNSMINLRMDDYEEFEDRFYEIEDEIAIIYGHLEELSEFKKNKSGEAIKVTRDNGLEEVKDSKN